MNAAQKLAAQGHPGYGEKIAKQVMRAEAVAARKGDLVAIEVVSSYTSANSFERHESVRWELAKVASATRDGQVSSVQSPSGTVRKLVNYWGARRTVIADRSTVDVDAVLSAWNGSVSLPDLDAVRTVVEPYRT